MSYIDIQNKIRTAMFQRLNGSISYSGVILPIRDSFARNEDTGNYIIIADQSDVPLPESRVSFKRSSTITIEIVTKFPPGSTGSRTIGEQIAEQIYSLIMSKNSSNWLTLGANIIVGDVEMDFSNTLTDTQTSANAKVYIYRKIIRFRFDITMR